MILSRTTELKQPLVVAMENAVAAVLQAQGREVTSRLTKRTVLLPNSVNLTHWLPHMQALLKPFIATALQTSMRATFDRVRNMRFSGMQRPVIVRKAFHGIEKALIRPSGRFSYNWDIYNPRILDAIDQLTFDFCRQTLDDTTNTVNNTFADLRVELKEGVVQFEAISDIISGIARLFTSRKRATMITITEFNRAVNAGQFLAAEDTGLVTAKTWIASATSCPKCLALDGKEVPLNVPFKILLKPGPYSVIMYPPYHPWCDCAWNEVL